MTLLVSFRMYDPPTLVPFFFSHRSYSQLDVGVVTNLADSVRSF